MRKILTILLVLAFLLSTPVCAAEQYASLKILPGRYGYLITKAEGHIYSIDFEYNDAEEGITYVLKKDKKVVHRFNEYWGPNGLVQIDGIIYISTVDAVYKYSGGKLTKITKEIQGCIESMSTNGKDLYIVCDDDTPAWDGAYLEGSYYKIGTSGKVTPLEGDTVPVDFKYSLFSINKDCDRLARVPFGDDGTYVRNLSTGIEYFQRNSEEDVSYANGDYAVEATLYYNNCLLVNVKGSLVYYDDKNNAHVIIGNMQCDRYWRESYVDVPADLWPIETGPGNKVALGYVCTWTIGDDGYIYGITMQNTDTYYAFRLTIPDSIKKVITYKKTK